MITEEELKYLRSFKETTDDFNIRFKQIIKRKLLDNKLILHVLNNKELEDSEAEPDEYFNVNIFDFYNIHPTQSNVKNFICYEVQFDETARYNQLIKIQQIVFHVVCEQKNIIDKETYIDRHDMLSALILDEFNWKNYFGTQIRCVQNKPSNVDNDYICRTLIFEMETINNIAKTKYSKQKIFNYEVET